jgi:hypothetical protein
MWSPRFGQECRSGDAGRPVLGGSGRWNPAVGRIIDYDRTDGTMVAPGEQIPKARRAPQYDGWRPPQSGRMRAAVAGKFVTKRRGVNEESSPRVNLEGNTGWPKHIGSRFIAR